VVRKLTHETPKIKEATSKEVSVVDEHSMNKEIYGAQLTTDGLPKLILSKPKVASKGSYNVLSYSYGYSF